jgi:signal transduction histidine kinase
VSADDVEAALSALAGAAGAYLHRPPGRAAVGTTAALGRLSRETAAALTADATVVDVALALQRGDHPRRMETVPDIGNVELSGLFTLHGGSYRHRSRFHEEYLVRALGRRTVGDLHILHQRWSQAAEVYRGLPEDDPGQSWIRPAALAVALGAELSTSTDGDYVRQTLVDVLHLVFGHRPVGLCAVQGRRALPAPAIGVVEASVLAAPEVEQVIRTRQAETIWTRDGVRTLAPLLFRGDVPAEVAWLLVYGPSRGQGRAHPFDIQPFLMFGEQLLTEHRRRRESARLDEIAVEITAGRALSRTLERILGAALELTGAAYGNIVVRGEDGRLSVRAESGSRRAPGEDGSRLTTRVLEDPRRHPTVIDDVDGWLLGSDVQSGAWLSPWAPGMVSAIAVPIVGAEGDSRFQAVMHLESPVPYTFHASHRRLVLQLTRFTAMAMVNAERFSRAEHDMIISRIFGGIAHESSSHLATIGIAAEHGIARWDTIPRERARERLRVIKHEVDEIVGIIEDFRWLVRPDMTLPSPADLGVVLREAVAEAGRRVAPGRDDWVELSVAAEEPLVVLGRGRLLRRAIANLLVNAVEAVRAKDPESPRPGDVRATIRPGEGGSLVLTVSDQGPGLPQGDVFAPYFTTKGRKGLGLGLSICKAVVEAHRGQVRAQAGVPAGAELVIELPRAPASEPERMEGAR